MNFLEYFLRYFSLDHACLNENNLTLLVLVVSPLCGKGVLPTK